MMTWSNTVYRVTGLLILVVFLSGCSSYTYIGRDIDRIEYTTVDYFGGFTIETHIDLVNGQVLSRNYIYNDDELGDFTVVYEFDLELIRVFLDEAGGSGLFELEEEYPSPGDVMDGGGWTLTVVYADGSSTTSTGDNNWPTEVFEEADIACYHLYGDDLFGTLPSSFRD